MSFSRHAYRHALQPSSGTIVDYMWIGDDFLASTFRRFNNTQRRHGSRVPGPLEARRRLLGRRNTVSANLDVPGSHVEIAALFGRNGREHVAWGSLREPPGLDSKWFIFSKPPSPPIPKYEQLIESDMVDDFPLFTVDTQLDEKKASCEQHLERFILRTRWKIADVKEIVRSLDIDPRREKEYSRFIFKLMLSESQRRQDVAEDLVVFLDDPFLNPPGAENYAAIVKHLCSCRANSDLQKSLLAAIYRSLELGVISDRELMTIIGQIPDIRHRNSVLGRRASADVVHCYRHVWNAIGRCSVLGYKDLSWSTIDTFLTMLAKVSSRKSALFLASDIVTTAVACGHRFVAEPWAAKIITQWLELLTQTTQKDATFYSKGIVPFSGQKIDYSAVRMILDCLHPYAMTECIIRVTETLAVCTKYDEHRKVLFQTWQDFLALYPDLSNLAKSVAWFQLESDQTSNEVRRGLSLQQRILLRLWILRSFSQSPSDEPHLKRRERDTSYAVYNLLVLFESLSKRAARWSKEDIPIELLEHARKMKIPMNGVLTLALDLNMRRRTSRNTRRAFDNLESLTVSFPDLFVDLDSYNALKPHFFGVFNSLVQQIDISGCAFVEQSLQLAMTGQSKELWTLVRILRSHTAFKIALSRAWYPRALASQKALIPLPSARFPDPHISLDLVNLVAAAVAKNQNITARRAVQIIYWLYAFLKRHNAPIEPILVRAIYYANILRYRKEGLPIPRARYGWTYSVVNEVEGPEVAEKLKWEGLL